jgi:arginyl-tRNA synthetase
MKERIEKIIKEVLKDLGKEDASFNIEHPEDLKNGDYSTNVALVCSKNLSKKSTRNIRTIKGGIEKNLPKDIEKIEIAGPGFINFFLSRDFFCRENKSKFWKK